MYRFLKYTLFVLQTSASLKFTILNPKGRIWTMVAGGGASVIYADTVSFHVLWIYLILAKNMNKGTPQTDIFRKFSFSRSFGELIYLLFTRLEI